MSENQNNPRLPTSRRVNHFRQRVIGGLIVVVALAATLAGFEYVASTQSAVAGICGQLSLTRHGLPCDIPLPPGATTVRISSTATPESGAITVWKFHISWPWNQTRDDIQRGLHDHGWPCVVVRNVEGLYVIGARKPDRPGQVVVVEVEVGSATSSDITISLFERLSAPPFLTCS